ncbi:MAG TPA: cache domain-containing protein [Thermotogota bacterium]|nr:cache domain-containing protein [Thermotogota bacterium]HPJ89769.1 cache domain-containing protein [Thermotogota bacterium]HPR97535.1 cache domain-containing protein [Thermotogota bacterium]
MKRKSKLPIILKTILPFLLTMVLVIITIYGFVIPKIGEILFDQKKEKVKDLCKNTIQLAEQYYERFRNGELSEGEAKRRLIERVRIMRYGDELKDYFWIIDIDYTMIMHPYLPETEGTSMEYFEDSNGYRVFYNMSKLVKENKAGYLEYTWQLRDEEGVIEDKISYVQLFEPWNWIIGTGVYYSDIKRNTAEVTEGINFALTLISVLIGLVSLYIIIREIKAAEYRQQTSEEREKLISRLRTINTELNMAKKEAEEANTSKDQFLANITHDLRTPLNGIVGFSELLEDSSEKERTIHFSEYTGYIRRSGKYLLQMINDILDFSKAKAKKITLERSIFCLNDVISEVVTSLSFFSLEREIPIVFEAEGTFTVEADEMRLKKVFYNLLSNAIKYTKDHEPINVELKQSKNELLITFRDRGIGISSEDQKRIFSPFVQINRIKTEGTGLGLAIAKEITELHDGYISLESEVDRGSMFTVHLPRDILTEEEVSTQRPPVPEFLKDKKICIVEDDAISRKLMILFLKRYEMKPIDIPSGTEFLDYLKTDKPDIILMDIQLPDINGMELKEKLKETGAGEIPVIALTAFSSEEKTEELLKKGFFAVCHKPVDSAILLKRLAEALRPDPPINSD